MRRLGDGHGGRRRRRALVAAVLIPLATAGFVGQPARAMPSAPVGPVVSVASAGPVGRAQAAGQVPTEGRFVEDVFGEVDVIEDIPYTEAVNVDGVVQTLHLDLYQPAGDTAARRPVIMLVHGGYFAIGNNKDDTYGAGPSIAELFARKGFVVVSIQYRLRPDMGFYPDVDMEELEAANLDAYDDSLAAVEWLRDHAAEHRIDPRAIVPNGPSAGGAVAWNLAWMQGSSARPGPSGIPAAVSIAGAPFVTSEITGEPLAAPSPGDPPVLAVHGTADDVVPFRLAEGPCSQAADVGVRCDLVPLDGVGHPGLDSRFLDHVEMIESRTVAFLAEVVLAPLGYFDEPVPEQPDDGPGPGPLVPAPPATPIPGEPAFTG